MSAGPPTAAYAVRAATPADASTIAGHRVSMFRDMGVLPAGGEGSERAAAALREAASAYLSRAIADGVYVGWLATPVDAPERVVSGAGVLVREIIPSPGPDGSVRVAPQTLILNVYTEPAWRRMGIAERLMREAIAWADARGMSGVVLHASHAGRALYERMGFQGTNEMRLHGAPYAHLTGPRPS